MTETPENRKFKKCCFKKVCKIEKNFKQFVQVLNVV